MSRLADVTDSTDWLNTSLSALTQVDAALRCQVCKDFYNTPMITSCAHTFCSLCIRRCLASDGKCPVCRASEQEVRLRRNWTVEEVVDAFQRARPRILEQAKRAEGTEESGVGRRRRSKRKLSDTDLEEEAEARPSQSRRTRSQTQNMARQPVEEEVMVIDDDEESDFQPEDGLVACPMCRKRMKEEEVFPHLDRCQGDQKEISSRSSRSQSRTTIPSTTIQKPPPQQPTKPPDRLPQLNYSLLKDNALRKKLQELGIPNLGPRPLLIRRHTEWINLWNANCDSSRPRTKRELLRELDVWERTQGGQAPNGGGLGGGPSSVMRKDFDGQGYARSHRDDFDKLIAEARSKRNAVAGKQHQPGEEARLEDMETEYRSPTTAVTLRTDRGETPSIFSPIRTNHDQRVWPPNEDNHAQPDRPPDRPYENNEEALSKIRAKVQAANKPNHTEVRSSQSPSSSPSSSQTTPLQTHSPPSAPHPQKAQTNDSPHRRPSPEKSNYRPAVTQNVSLPTPPALTGMHHESLITTERSSGTGTSKIRKMPMFAAPEEPVRDVDIGGSAH